MAYNTRSIKKDVDGRPIPQYFNQMTDNYEPLLGEDGAARSILWGPNGQPLSVIDNKLAVRAADLETLIGALNDSAVTNPANAASVIAALKGLLSVVGKEATLGQILSALAPLATESTLSSLASAVAKETTLAQVLSALGALATETTLGGVKTAVDVLAGTVDTQAGVQKVALTGQNVEILAEYQGYTGHNPQAPSARYFGATVGLLPSVRPLDVRRFGGLVLKLTNGYNVAVTHRVVAFKAGEPGSPIWVDVTEDADLPAGAEFIYEIPNRYPYIALRVHAPARDQTGETGLDVDIVGSVFYA